MTHQWRHLPTVGDPNVCQFFLDGKSIEYVESYVHLGHVIVHDLNLFRRHKNRRGCLIGRINSVLRFFGSLDKVVKTSLLKSYCYSLYGCEL